MEPESENKLGATRDLNTTFFHRIANMRRRKKNMILYLESNAL